MKLILIGLISLISFVSAHAQFVPFNLPGEIVKVGRKMVSRHAAAQADTCLKIAEVKAAKLYTDFLEERLQKSEAETALLRFQVDQRGERNVALENMNVGLAEQVKDHQTNLKITGWAAAGGGAIVGMIITMLVRN